MSSILKALKKLEDEKTTRKPESLKINSEILRDSASFRLTPLNVGIAAVLLFLCGGGATYFYLKSGSETSPPPSVSEAKKPEFPRAVTPPPPHIPVVHLAADRIVSAAKPPSSTPSASTSVSPYRAVATQKSDLQPEVNTSLKERVADKNIAPAVEEAKEITPAVNVHKSTTALRPYLKVDGIAFQEGVDSVAIINGIQATKSSVVEGAKIEAVLRDRVLFSFGSDKFEILLGRANH